MWSWNTVTVGEPAVGLLISFIFHIIYTPPPPSLPNINLPIIKGGRENIHNINIYIIYIIYRIRKI